MSSSITKVAISLLKQTSYFANAPEALLQELAGKLERKTFTSGDILVREGDDMEYIIIVERGRLLRTKLAVSVITNSDPDHNSSSNNNKDQKKQQLLKSLSHDELIQKSIVIDALETRGRVSGLLHSFDSTSKTAFATISAEGDDAVVWLLSKQALREVLVRYDCLFLLSALSRELRTGSKSLRGMLKQQGHLGASNHDGVPTVRVLCYDSANWVSEGFNKVLEAFNAKYEDKFHVVIEYTTDRLSVRSATYAAGYDVVCIFVNDSASSDVLKTLSQLRVRMLALRCAGFDQVDSESATAFGMTVARVPAYSPYAVAEMAITLLMSLNRRIIMAGARVKMTNFSLDSSLMGIDIYGKTVGVLGTGKIGGILCDILFGFGVATLYCYDSYERDDLKAKGAIYVADISMIYQQCDIIFIMLPLLESTYHTINKTALDQMKDGVILINTSRGALVDTKALLEALRSGKVGGVGMDVYENEQQYFFQDWSARHVEDNDLLSLIGQPNVLLTAHQAFFTKEAVGNIVETTLQNIADFQNGKTGLDHPNNCLPVRK